MASESWGENDEVVENWGANDTVVSDASGVSPGYRPSKDRRSFLQVPLEWVGRQAQRVSTAGPTGALQAVQDIPLSERGSSPYQVGNMAVQAGKGFLRGIMDPSQVSTKQAYEDMGMSGQDIPFMSVDGRQIGVSPAAAAAFVTESAAPFPGVGTAKRLGSALKMPFTGGAKAIAATTDAITGGGAAGDFLKGVSRAVKQTSEQKAAQFSAVFNPKVLPDAEQYKAIMRRAGVADEDMPAAVTYGELSKPARDQKVLAQTAEGGPELERYNQVRTNLQSAYGKAVDDIGTVLDPKNAGEMVRNGVLDGVERIGDNVQMTHAKVAEKIPFLTLDPASHQGLTKKLDDALMLVEDVIKDGGLNPSELSSAQEVVRTVNLLKKKGGNYKELTNSASRIGRTVFQKARSLERISDHDRALQDIYFALNDARIGTLKTIDPKMAEDVLQSNAYLTEALNDKGIIARAIGDKNKPGLSIFEQAIANGDDKTIGAVKRFLTPDQWQSTKASLLDYYTGKSPEGEFSFKGALNRMGTKRAQVVLSTAFDDPRELQGAVDFLKAGKRTGDPLLQGSAGQLEHWLQRQAVNPIRTVLDESLNMLSLTAKESGMVRAERLAIAPADRVAFTGKPRKGLKKPIGAGLKGVRALTTAEPQNED